jgi:hypothetical protein
MRGLRVALLILGFVSGSAQAGVLIDQNLMYIQNSVKTDATESSTHYHAALTLSATMSKDFYFGWKSNYFGDTLQTSAGTMKIAGLEMGPRVGYYLTKGHWMSLNLAYLAIHNATYTSASGTVSKLSGSGFDFELAFHPDSFSKLSPGISLLYHLGTYSTSQDSNNTVSTVSNSRNGFFPSIYLHWRFGEE